MSQDHQHAIDDDQPRGGSRAVTIPSSLHRWSFSIACCWPWLISLVYGPGLLFRGPLCIFYILFYPIFNTAGMSDLKIGKHSCVWLVFGACRVEIKGRRSNNPCSRNFPQYSRQMTAWYSKQVCSRILSSHFVISNRSILYSPGYWRHR